MGNSISVRKHGPLTIRVEQDQKSIVLRAGGELDIASAPGLEHSLLHALESGASSIILDLTAVSFIDPVGLRVLLWAAARSGEDGDRLRIDCGSPAIRQLIDLTGLGREVPLTA
jgi:stage II sporulation protein AA (anti-sigma F factor antagonist)